MRKGLLFVLLLSLAGFYALLVFISMINAGQVTPGGTALLPTGACFAFIGMLI